MDSLRGSVINVGMTPSFSITANSNRKWLKRRRGRVRRFLRAFNKMSGVDRRSDWTTILELLYTYYPDEGRKLIENFELSNQKKFNLFLDYLIYSPQITWLAFADERMGKDAMVCFCIEEAIFRMKEKGLTPPRIVTLGNIKLPPFVEPEDQYWSFKDIPSGTVKREVWIYCSELEVMLPARDGMAPENKLFSMISGTFAQNHIKLIGCVKLASKVDLNAIRGCNIKSFKYINPEKLNIIGVERNNILSPLGDWLLPSHSGDKENTLFAFDSQLFTLPLPLPDWWTHEYSEQFNKISEEDIWSFIEATCDEDTKVNSIITIISQKFRNKKITKKQISQFIAEQKSVF